VLKEPESLITAKGLFKKYENKVAVDRISFQVKKGEVFGIVGPNGAGKTTTVNMITGKCIIDDGELSILGMDARSHDRGIRKLMGVVSQEDSLDPDLSAYENLLIYAGYFGVISKERINELLKFFDLTQYVNYNVMELSGGMRRRLTLARGLINDPLLLILDEPTTGLDPQVRHDTWDKLLQIKEQGITILLTTHYMEEVTKLCDRVMIMHNGSIKDMDTPQHIVTSRYPTDVIEIKFNNGSDFSKLLGGLKEFKFSHEFSSKFGLIIPQKFEDVMAIHKRLIELYPLAYPVRRPPNLEDAFLAITGTSLHEGG
jgi:lipooligosaccharide transport system ATP-binding protein